MYYILKEGTPIKRFAGFSDENTGDAPWGKVNTQGIFNLKRGGIGVLPSPPDHGYLFFICCA
jgi:hypothetical protein